MENKYVNSMVVNYLKEFSNKRMKEKAIGKYKDSIKTEEDFTKYKSMLSKGMVEAIERQPFIDTTIELKDVKPVFYSYMVESLHTEKILKMYIEDMPRALDRLILFDFKNNKEVKNFEYNISQYSEGVLNKILSFNPDYKTEYVYDFNANEDKKKLINDVNKIPNEPGVWLPRGVFYKKGAIKINIEYLEEQSFIRKLTSEEVNTIIDRDFRLVNGFYKYLETSNSKAGIMLNREEIFELISKKYLLVNLFIKYKVQYSSEKILYYKLKNKNRNTIQIIRVKKRRFKQIIVNPRVSIKKMHLIRRFHEEKNKRIFQKAKIYIIVYSYYYFSSFNNFYHNYMLL